MSEKTKKVELFTLMIVVGILFIVMGNYLPALVDEYRPISYFYTVEQYSPADVYEGDTLQEVVLVRTVPFDIPGSYIDELTLVKDDGSSSQQIVTYTGSAVYEFRDNQYVNTTLIFSLPSDLEPGTYYWRSAITLYLPRDVQRTVTLVSEEFEVIKK